ncbi:hypothetical protein [Methanobacterium aggregans]|uniref:hypothetical protein n=1 Tax=Methanobacterium aggregans TaxID=1615586 RepID=UPI001AE6280D|nr:hypothetical protein [Methanobacterium aggregans]MBP2045409.1 magnesium-transporting ATPase (P-type) [Methanobacterium aggregans]
MKINIWTFIYFLAALPFLGRFFGFLTSGNPSYLITGSTGLILILLIFREYQYFYKILFLLLIGLILFSGLTITYIYLFEPIYATKEYYYAIGTLLLYMVFFAYGYWRRGDITFPDNKSKI